MSITLSLLSVGVGAFIFVFSLWRRLREDLERDELFTLAFYVIVGVFVGSLLFGSFYPKWWFWFALVGATAGFLVAYVRFRFRFIEVLEAVGVSLLLWFAIFLTVRGISMTEVASSLAGGALLFLYFFYTYLDDKYLYFSWYRSGKIGFAGLTCLGIFFLLRALVAIFYTDMVSSVGAVDVLISAIVSFTIFLLVYNLAQKDI